MFCHWRYVLDNLFGPVRSVSALGAIHVPERIDEDGEPVRGHGRGRRVRDVRDRGRADRADELVLVRARRPRRAVRAAGRRHRRAAPSPACASAGSSPPRRRRCRSGTPTSPARSTTAPPGSACPTASAHDNGFKIQWERFLRHVAFDEPFPWDFLEAAKGIQLAELGMQSWARAPLRRRPGARRCERGRPTDRARCGSRATALTARDRRPYTPGAPSPYTPPARARRAPRIAFAAAHVVADPLAPGDPDGPAQLDWEATLAFRRHLWSHGFRVAEAMDTAQRGMGLDWAATQELIRRSVAEAQRGRRRDRRRRGHRPPRAPGATLADVRAAYEEQCAFVEGTGAQVILMASRALAAAATGPGRLRRDLRPRAGAARAAGDPALARPDVRPGAGRILGRSDDLDAAAETMLAIIAANRGKVDGVKVSLLDHEREVAHPPRAARRRAALHGRRLPLPRADPRRRARPQRRAARHLRRDRAGRGRGARRARRRRRRALRRDPRADRPALAPHLPARRPTATRPGIVFLAYLNDHQGHFRMVGGKEGARSVTHLAELFVLADRAGLLRDPELAAAPHARRARARRGGAAMSPRARAVAAEPQPDHRRAVLAAGGDRGVRARRADRDRPVAPQGRRDRRRGRRAADPRRPACASRACAAAASSPPPTPPACAPPTRTTAARWRRPPTLGTDVLVLVCGPPLGRDVDGARAQILAGIERLVPHARGRTACGSRSSRCTR